ncbi:gas vesicle protein GvpO [Streptomyces sp. NPDC002851]
MAGGVSTAEAIQNAAAQLAELPGKAPESVSAVRRPEEGWDAESSSCCGS